MSYLKFRLMPNPQFSSVAAIKRKSRKVPDCQHFSGLENLWYYSFPLFRLSNFCCRKCCKIACVIVPSGFGVMALPSEWRARFVPFSPIQVYHKYEVIPCLTQEHQYKHLSEQWITHTQEDKYPIRYVDTVPQCINYLYARYVR